MIIKNDFPVNNLYKTPTNEICCNSPRHICRDYL